MLEPQVILLALLAAIAIVSIILYVTWLLYKKAGRGYALFDIIREAGWPSLARFQFLAWTLIVVFCFTTICVMRFLGGNLDIPADIPENLLALMGISAGVTAVSSGVSRNKYGEETKKRSKQEYTNLKEGKNWGTMLLENDAPSLTRFQMLSWTLLSVFLYGAKFLAYILTATEAEALVLPDIESTLLVLMGVSQGAYVGGKWVAPSKPTVFNATFNETEDRKTKKKKQYIVLNGTNFGGNKGLVVFDDTVIPQNQVTWNNDVVTVEVDDLNTANDNEVILKIGAKETKYPFNLESQEQTEALQKEES